MIEYTVPEDPLPPPPPPPKPRPVAPPVPAPTPIPQPVPSPPVVVAPPAPTPPTSAPPSISRSHLIAIAGAFGVMLVLVLGGLFISADHSLSRSPLAAAAAEYRRTLPVGPRETARKVRDGQLKTVAEVVADLKEHARPLAEAIGNAAKDRADKAGKITDAPGLSADLLQLSRGLE